MKLSALILSILYSYTAGLTCDSNEIACTNQEKCIPHNYVCDRDKDCADDSDENSKLCSAWRNDDCGRNEVKCTRGEASECMSIYSYCTSDSPSCQGDLDRRICKMLKNGVLEDLDAIIVELIFKPDNLKKSMEMADKFRQLLPYTLNHGFCPSMYTLVGDQCLSVFFMGSMSWGEAREFCKMMNGDLLSFRNVSHYATVVKHLQQNDLTSSFWVGGRLQNKSEGWIWVDGSPIELGSPYWTTRYSKSCVERNVTVADAEEVCFHYHQAPEKEPRGYCAGLDFEQFFYMGDEDCVRKMSPLCVYEGPENPSPGLVALVNTKV